MIKHGKTYMPLRGFTLCS